MPKSSTPDKNTSGPKPSGTPAAPQGASKLDAKRTRAGIGDLVAGVSLSGPAGNPFTSRGRDATEARSGDAREVRHPIGSGLAFERVEDVYRMDPKKIVMEGAYIRQFIEDSAFHQLRAAVRIERDIGQHIGVRVVGPPTDARRVLVYGMRRWRAALAEGLERVPVRDYGRITEDKAIELQMLENEIRADPHPVDTALGFYLLSRQEEWNQKRIAEVFDKNKGYVSEMVRVGEALAQLSTDERAPLYTAPRVTVRAFQSIAQVKDVAERRSALLALLQPASEDAPAAPPALAASDESETTPTPARARGAGDAQAERRRQVDEAIFHARPLRNGRSFRVRWTDDELKARAPEVIEEFKRHFLEEYTHLLHRANVLATQAGNDGEGQGTSPVDIAKLVASVAKDVARVDSRLATTNAGAVKACTEGAE
jgi:ParB-like chromosome segregation protein Spo0J